MSWHRSSTKSPSQIRSIQRAKQRQLKRFARAEQPVTGLSKWLPALVMLACLIFWQLLAMWIAKPYILPSPIGVLKTIWAWKAALFGVHLPATAAVAGIGLAISIGFGSLLAVLMGEFIWAQRAFYPIVVGSQTIPTTAIAPLFVLWLGYGIWSKVLVTVLMTFFPIVINLHEGLCSVKKEQVEYFLTLDAKPTQVLLKLKIPHALPFFFAALKMAVPWSLIAAAIAEWLGGNKGLGYFSKRMITQLDGAGVFAPVVILSIVAILCVKGLTLAQRMTIRWQVGDV